MEELLSAEELRSKWSLSFEELEFVWSKKKGIWVDYATQLKFYLSAGRFPESLTEVHPFALEYTASQLGPDLQLSWSLEEGRSLRRRREEIRNFLKIVESTDQDVIDLRFWVAATYGGTGASLDEVNEAVLLWCLKKRITPPNSKALRRIWDAMSNDYDTASFQQIFNSLESETARRLEGSLEGHQGYIGFADMKTHPGRVSRKTFMQTVRQLEFVKEANVSSKEIEQAGSVWCSQIHRRVQQETAFEMGRHEKSQKLAMYAVYLSGREGELTDLLLDLIIETIQKIRKHAEKQVAQKAGKRVERSYDERALMRRFLEIAIEFPDGSFREHIYPIVSPDKMQRMLNGPLPDRDYANDVFDWR